MEKLKRFYKFPETVYFDDFIVRHDYLSESSETASLFPYINVIDNLTEIEIQLIVPHISLINLNVSVSFDSVMFVCKGREVEKDRKYYIKEFSVPEFMRNVKLPSNVHPNDYSKELKNGVLHLYLKKV